MPNDGNNGGGNGGRTIPGNKFDNLLTATSNPEIINGRDGVDTVSYANSTGGVSVDLLSGAGAGGHAEGDSYISIENVEGSTFDDTLTGDAGANVLNGGDGNDLLAGLGGADTLIGGAGTDTASYATSAAGVQVDLSAGTAAGGDAEGDSLSGIENLIGSAFDDMLTGDAGANVLDGGDGNDLLFGGGGADTLIGGEGDNVLDGGDGDDVLHGIGGANKFIGGDGRDTVTYELSDVGINTSIDLDVGFIDPCIFSGGACDNDTTFLPMFSSIERVLGTSFDDVLSISGAQDGYEVDGLGGNDQISGDDYANILIGGDGNDILIGDAGDDLLVGGAGDDSLAVTAGANILDGGEGVDTADYSGAQAGVGVLLEQSFGSGGEDHGVAYSEGLLLDDLINIENVMGSAFDDAIEGTSGANTLDGGAGDDLLVGGLGDDILAGGLGADLLAGERGDDTLTGGEGADEFAFSLDNWTYGDGLGDGLDVILDFEDGVDQISFYVTEEFDPLAGVSSDGDDTLISYGTDGSTIRLVDVDAALIGAEDFVFVVTNLPDIASM